MCNYIAQLKSKTSENYKYLAKQFSDIFDYIYIRVCGTTDCQFNETFENICFY